MVFLCHDVNDIFMEGAKMARYAEHKWLPTALFAVFMLSWFASRIYYFPAYVIRSVYHEPIEVSPPFPPVPISAALTEPCCSE